MSRTRSAAALGGVAGAFDDDRFLAGKTRERVGEVESESGITLQVSGIRKF
jgi:hypothetical protein